MKGTLRDGKDVGSKRLTTSSEEQFSRRRIRDLVAFWEKLALGQQRREGKEGVTQNQDMPIPNSLEECGNLETKLPDPIGDGMLPEEPTRAPHPSKNIIEVPSEVKRPGRSVFGKVKAWFHNVIEKISLGHSIGRIARSKEDNPTEIVENTDIKTCLERAVIDHSETGFRKLLGQKEAEGILDSGFGENSTFGNTLLSLAIKEESASIMRILMQEKGIVPLEKDKIEAEKIAQESEAARRDDYLKRGKIYAAVKEAYGGKPSLGTQTEAVLSERSRDTSLNASQTIGV